MIQPINYALFKCGIRNALRTKQNVYCAINTPVELYNKFLKICKVNKLDITSKELGVKMGRLHPVLFISYA